MEKILFVDDDRDLLELYRDALEGEFQIEIAESAAAAISLLEQHQDFVTDSTPKKISKPSLRYALRL